MRLEFTYTPEDFDEWQRSRLPRPGAKFHFWRGLLGWVLFMGLALLLVYLVRHDKAAPRGRAPPAPTDPITDILIPLLPWVAIFGLIWFFVFRQMRQSQGKSIWAKNKVLQDPHTVTVDDEGVELASSVAATRWRWAAYEVWAETDNLFILKQPQDVALLIPKRAATAEQLAELREVFRVHVAPPTGGFPVLRTGGGDGR